MFGPILSVGIGALIGAIWDDGDDGMGSSNIRPPGTENLNEEEFNAYTLMVKSEILDAVMYRSPNVDFQEAIRISEEIYRKHGGNRTATFDEAYRVGRVIDSSGDYDASAAERQYVRETFIKQTTVDSSVEEKQTRIYKSVDPTDDGDMEGEDAFSFETEIENIFGIEQMAPSEEDIASDTDIQDWDITEPTDEISQDREIVVGDDTVSPEDEISQIEETTPFEPVFYPNQDDIDMDPTDDFEEVLYPTERYDQSNVIDDFLQWPEQELDDFVDELESNVFASAAWTFDQDMSQEALESDNTYQDIGEELNVIDFENFLDDTSSVPLDLISDHLGVPFFQWIDEPPGGEILDVSPF